VGLRLGDSYNPPLVDSIPYCTAIELQREREEKRGTEAWDSQEAAPEEFLAVVDTAWFAQRASIVLEGMKKRERDYLPWFRLVDGWRCIRIR